MFLGKALQGTAFDSVWKGHKKGELNGGAKSIHFFTTCPEAWGGSEELWSGAARRLVHDDFQVTATLTCFEGTHPRVVDLIDEGVRMERFRGVPLLRRFGIGGRWEPTLTVARLRALKPKLAVISQGENIDGYRFILYCRAASIPYVIICQKAMEDLYPPDSYREELRMLFGEAERVYFVSNHNRTVTETMLAKKLPNAEVVWNPFIVDCQSELPWPPLDDGRFRLACVARLWIRDKAQDVLLKVLAQDKWKKRPLEVRFYGSGVNEVGLRELSQMLGTESQVRFCGFAENVTDVWRQCHGLILPSRHEGLPLALVEAMLCGRPAITTNAGGIGEALEDNVSGFMAPACTVEAIDEAMERAWNRRAEWQKIGMTAARLIRQKIPQDPCGLFADKLKEIYRRVVSSR